MTNSFAEPPSVQGWLDIQHKNNFIEITPRSKSNSDVLISYSIISTKKGINGNSRSQQSGNVSLQAGQETGLAKLKLNYGQENEYQISLKIYHQKKLIRSVTKTIP